MSKDDSVNNLYDLLELIRERPALYIGEKSITALSQFISAFQFGLTFGGGKFKEEERPPFRHFNLWLANGFGRSGGAASFKRILLAEALFVDWNAEEAALDLFFEFLDEFRKREEVDRAVIRFDQPTKSALCSSVTADGSTTTALITQELKIVEYKYKLKEDDYFQFRHEKFKPSAEFYLTYAYLNDGNPQLQEQRFERFEDALRRGQEEFNFEAERWKII